VKLEEGEEERGATGRERAACASRVGRLDASKHFPAVDRSIELMWDEGEPLPPSSIPPHQSRALARLTASLAVR
jgi:hypothetical protein